MTKTVNKKQNSRQNRIVTWQLQLSSFNFLHHQVFQ